MTTEEKIKVMQAYLEGKQIQCKAVKYDICIWLDDNNPSWDWNNCEYRIKSEPTYRPYKDIEEMLEDFKKRAKGLQLAEGIQQPVFSNLWLNHKNCGLMLPIAGIDKSDEKILLGDNWTILKIVFDDWTYLDGSPFGIME